MGTCWADYDLWSRRVETLMRKLGRAGSSAGFESALHWAPPTDVFETRTGVTVKMEIPGVRASDLAIALVDDRLVVKGRRADPDAGRRTSFQQMEIAYGGFAKIVLLRGAFDRDGIRAGLKDGFLSILIPRAREPAPRRVAVEITCD